MNAEEIYWHLEQNFCWHHSSFNCCKEGLPLTLICIDSLKALTYGPLPKPSSQVDIEKRQSLVSEFIEKWKKQTS